MNEVRKEESERFKRIVGDKMMALFTTTRRLTLIYRSF
jgi:hypothetical protein